MGHEVHAIIALHGVLPAISKHIESARTISLPGQFAMMIVSGDVFEKLHADADSSEVTGPEGFLYLSNRICKILAEASSWQPIAYIETDYSGGNGTQRSAVWDQGKVTTRSMWHTDSVPSDERPINAALRKIGVPKAGALDEFDAIGLGWARDDETWEKYADIGVRIPDKSDGIFTFLQVWKSESPDGKLHPCPCCRYRTLSGRGDFEPCPICNWEDDGQDSHDADRVRGGPNHDLSLTEARRNFEAIGANHPDDLERTRPPKPDEERVIGPEFKETNARYQACPPMRILHISTRLILGGSQENTVLSCEGQARTGHEVHLAFGPIYGPEGSMLDRVQNFRVGEDTITTHNIPHLIRAINPIADLRCYFHLKKLIRDLNPDIVHTHSSKAGILGRLAAWSVYKRSKQKRPAIVHTIHGPPFHKYQSNLKNLIYTLSERVAARRCHTIVSVADAMTSQYLARNIGKNAQYTTVRSGIETAPYHQAAEPQNRKRVRRELNLDEHDFVIGTVARLAELKGHDDLLDALADDLRANPHWKLLWVGDGWWKDRLMKRVADLNLDGQVITTGLVPPEQVPDMIAAMDILVHPSYREGLPRTVVQALLTGICPIANDVDGTREVCKDMQTGRLVPPGNTQALGDAIRWAAKNPDEAKALAMQGKHTCHTEFSAETMVHNLQTVYAEAIERA